MNTCLRCGAPRTLYVVGERYCTRCKSEVVVLDEQRARRQTARARFSVAKSLDRWQTA